MLLLLPNQLFEKKYLPKINNILLIEEPVYFGFREKKYNFNKLKLVLHRASMKFYYDYLKKNNYNVKYIEYNNINYKNIFQNNITIFNPYDNFLEKKYKKYNSKINYINNPNFILNEKQIEVYYKKVKGKNIRHSAFYNYVKKNINILTNEKSYDILNRESLPKNIKIPKIPIKKNNKYINEAKKYINKHFSNNYGDVNNFIYPITYNESKKWLNNFIKNKLNNFGKYQDAIDNKNIFLFHSVISPMLNIGLLQPLDVVNKIKEYYDKNKINISDYEGFIRQIIGWREYQRFCYNYYYDKIKHKNIFKNKNKLDKRWYNGTTGIDPVDFFIKEGFKYGYLHHISRLMIIGNIMNLSEINPDEVYKWFMEFSCDSYDWVMIQNVYSMSQWTDNGLTMSKPYISTDNYIMKMGNFKKGNWNKIWKSLFYNFINNNKKIISNTPYKRNLKYYEKLTKKEKEDIKLISNNFIKNNK